MRTNTTFLPERIRAQLLALGLPGARHARDALAEIFPPEFNIAAAGLDSEDLARVLIHFAEHRIIDVARPAGVGASVKQVAPGWHFCQFYRDFDQLVGMVAPYVAEGLRHRQGCLWVLPDVAMTKAYEALGRIVPNVDAHLASGQLEVRTHTSWYLDASGRLKSFEEVSGALLERQDRALARGFTFLRAAGDAGWVSGTEESRAFVDYEMKINAAIGATKVAAVCTYRANVSADELVAIVTAHQDALAV